MLTIQNITNLLGKKFVLDGVGISDEHRIWECIEAIEFNTDYGTNDTFFYRFEFYNENQPNFPLCVYVNREASLGQYLLENNLMNTGSNLSLSEIKNKDIFAERIHEYMVTTLEEYIADQTSTN